VITEFTRGISAGAAPEYISLGSDGNLWFTEIGGGATRIGRVTIKGHHHK
jgi:streptogramin lyase